MKDYISECNNLNASEEHFIKVWCLRCRQSECTRSNAGKSLFELRVNSWQERLITHVPKLPEDHPSYNEISQKRFVRVGWEPQQNEQQIDTPPQEASVETSVAEPSRCPVRYIHNIPDQSGRSIEPPKERIVQPGGRIRL